MFAADGSRIATAADDGIARIWAADGTGEPLILDRHAGDLTSIAFNPDGTRIVTGSRDGSARIWRLTPEELIAYLMSATTVCLTESERMSLLEESADAARRGYEACERRHERTPLPRGR